MKHSQIFQMPVIFRLTLYILVAATLFPLSNCFKETSGYMNCQVNGKDFTASSVSASKTGDTITIKGKQGDVLIKLEVPLLAAIGTSYSFGEEYTAEYNGYWPINSTASTKYKGGNGTIAIIKINDKHIKATFSFTAYYADSNSTSVSATDGELDVMF